MVKDFKDISLKDLKTIKPVLLMFETIGISQQQLIEVFENVNKLKEENVLLKERVNELEFWKSQHIQEEIERQKSFQKDVNRTMEYVRKVEHDPFINR